MLSFLNPKSNIFDNQCDLRQQYMPVNVLIAAATEIGARVLERIPSIQVVTGGYSFREMRIETLISGIGPASTSWSLTKYFSSHPTPDLAINIGIAGSYRDQVKIGDVVVPVTDRFADLGIETKDGFLTLEEAGLADPDRFPFREGILRAGNEYNVKACTICRAVNAVTVNTATGSSVSIERIRKKYDPDIETMEGATFFYICSGERIPFLALRSISNMVEPRDRSRWNIPLALDCLAEKLKDFFLMI